MCLFPSRKLNLGSVVVEVTPRCNLNCSFCYNHWKKDGCQPPEEKGYGEIIKVLARLFKQTNLNHVTFSGGEPLLFGRLPELVLYCRRRHASVTVITNGSAGSADLYRTLVHLGVDLFELPFHSCYPDIHNQMAGSPSAWRNAVLSIETLQGLGARVVPVIVITKHNHATLGETLTELHRMGLNRVMLNRYNLGGVHTTSPLDVMADIPQLRFAFAQANDVAKRLGMSLSSNVCTPHCVLDPWDYKNISFSKCSPDITKRPITVSAGGDLRFCNHSPVVLGNVLMTPVAQIFANVHSDYKEFTKPDFCQACAGYEHCLGGCRAAAEQLGGTIHDIDPIVGYL